VSQLKLYVKIWWGEYFFDVLDNAKHQAEVAMLLMNNLNN